MFYKFFFLHNIMICIGEKLKGLSLVALPMKWMG